jgi:glucose/arabinose dehydrogenase
MRKLTPLVLLAALLPACRGNAGPQNSVPPRVTLQHHDVRLDQLPAPYATPSSGNPPRVVGRPKGATLTLPPGFAIAPFASGFDEPRNMVLAPNGDVILAESGGRRITILRDANHDGVAESRSLFAQDLQYPYGLAIQGGYLYVGCEGEIVRFAYTAGQTKATGPPQHLADLPAGGHATRNLIFSRDGSRMYVAIGSASNVSPEDPPRAAIMEYDPLNWSARVYAFGLRNPVGLAWQPGTNNLWTVVNERDGLGDDLVPDYLTLVTRGAFYGWPYSYLGRHEDPRRKGERSDLVARAVVPSVLIESHSAPIGVTFYEGNMFPASYRGDAFVALHGSWNRARRTGYSVIRVPFRNGKPAGGYDDFITGWAPDASSRSVWGRPAGLLVLGDGSLLVADDGGNVIWRVTYRK